MSIIHLENKKLEKLLTDRDVLLDDLLKVLNYLDKLEIKIKRFETLEKRITEKVEAKDLTEKGEAIIKKMEALNNEVVKIGKEISALKLAAIPAKMKEDHEALMKERAEKEQERNKIGLKIQKYKDRIIPITQKEMKPLLGEFEDFESVKLKKDKITIETFDRLEEFKAKFKR